MKPKIGQRWRFINNSDIIDYIAELIEITDDFFIAKVVHINKMSDIINNSIVVSKSKSIGQLFVTKLLTVNGPLMGVVGETYTYLEGQDRPEE